MNGLSSWAKMVPRAKPRLLSYKSSHFWVGTYAITIVNLFALSAMAGCVGGGGLGDYAIRYGFQRYQTDATIVTVIILLVLITIVQSIGNLLTRKMQ